MNPPIRAGASGLVQASGVGERAARCGHPLHPMLGFAISGSSIMVWVDGWPVECASKASLCLR